MLGAAVPGATSLSLAARRVGQVWWWILIWLLLALAAATTFVLLGWRLIRQVIALGREVARNLDRLTEAMHPQPQPYQPATSVLAEPNAGATSGPGAAG